MPRINYTDVLGQRHVVEVPEGYTVMEGALDHGIPGILAECGGACACATCHVHVAGDWSGRLPPVSDMEDAMLEGARDRGPGSRLACQIEVSIALDGLEVAVARNGA